MKSIRTKLMMAFLNIFILFIGFGLYQEQTATLEEIAASSTHLARSAEILNQRVRSFQIWQEEMYWYLGKGDEGNG